MKKVMWYFCGEILNIHDYTGDYNITDGFSAGQTAGKSAPERAKQEVSV
jgi:predicted flavoprotein YhiN